MNAVSQILGALIEAWGEVKVQKARVVLSLVGVVAAVAAMTIVIALGDLLLQSSRELAELYEGRSVTLRLTPESSSASSEGPAAGGPYQDASDPAAATGAQTAKRPDEKDTLGEAMGTLAERTDIHYWSRFSSGGGEIVETRQARASGQFRGYPLTKIGDMVDGVAFQGVDPSYAVIYRTRMLAGRWVESSDADQRLIPVVISQTLWDQLGAPHRPGSDRPAYERRCRDARRRRHQVEELLRTCPPCSRITTRRASPPADDLPGHDRLGGHRERRPGPRDPAARPGLDPRRGLEGLRLRRRTRGHRGRSSWVPSPTSSWSSAASSCSWGPSAC